MFIQNVVSGNSIMNPNIARDVCERFTPRLAVTFDL